VEVGLSFEGIPRLTQEAPVTASTATDNPGNLIDIAAVATRLGVTVRHVRRLVHERRIPYIKWGHLIRFDPNDIEQWIEAARVSAGLPPQAG